MFQIIAVDISGRHKINEGYYMVCAAVAVDVSASHIESVSQIAIKTFLTTSAPDVIDVVSIIETTVAEIKFPGIIVVEHGDLYNQPEWLSQKMFSREFKYQESLSERLAIEFAHHVSLSSRNLLMKELGID
ncbi:DUF2209 domain-containing protein [Methanococcoides methylutens]|uniref:DUF2209 domain-containing protein n=1 Tax=Methanococcoides methylutens TaxID=2226 RepID=UPI004044F340